MLTILLTLFLYFTSCDNPPSDNDSIERDTTEDATVIYYRCRINAIILGEGGDGSRCINDIYK